MAASPWTSGHTSLASGSMNLNLWQLYIKLENLHLNTLVNYMIYSIYFESTHKSGIARIHTVLQTRTQSLFMNFWGDRRVVVKLRRAGSHGKGRWKNSDWQILERNLPVAILPSSLPMRPRARLNLTTTLLSPQKFINSDWVRVWLYYVKLRANAEGKFNYMGKYSDYVSHSVRCFYKKRLYCWGSFIHITAVKRKYPDS